MIDFPASPTIGQVFTSGAQSWTYDGTKWLPSGLSLIVAPGINDNRIINGDMRIDQRGAARAGRRTVTRLIAGNSMRSQTGKGTWVAKAALGMATPGFLIILAFTASSAYAS